MAPRPYLKLRGDELLRLYETAKEDVDLLATLRAELGYRKTNAMRSLRAQVDEALARHAARSAPHQPPVRVPQPQHGLLPDSESSRGQDETQGRRSQRQPTRGPPTNCAERDASGGSPGQPRSTLGSIRPCGAIKDAPSRWTPPAQRDFEIAVGRNASRIETFIAALRALVKDMRKHGSGVRAVALESGEAIPLDGRDRGYRFPYDGDAELFEGAKVTIAIGSRTCDGALVAVSTGSLIVAVADDLGPAIRTCVLRIDNTAMIDALADRLDSIRNANGKFNLILADDVMDNLATRTAPSESGVSTETDLKLNSQQKVNRPGFAGGCLG